MKDVQSSQKDESKKSRGANGRALQESEVGSSSLRR
jgi:hypothetical protein